MMAGSEETDGAQAELCVSRFSWRRGHAQLSTVGFGLSSQRRQASKEIIEGIRRKRSTSPEA